MIVLWRLILGHLIADFLLQTREFVAWKRKSVWGLVAHSLVHLVIYTLLVFPYLNDVWVQIINVDIVGWQALLLITTFHFLIDYGRGYKLNDKIKRESKKGQSLYFLFDQFLHFMVIFIFFPIKITTEKISIFPEVWVLVLIFLILSTYFTTYLVHFAESDLFGDTDIPSFDEKYLTMSHRIILYLLFLFPGYFWIVFVAIWLLLSIMAKHQRLIDISNFSFYVSILLTFGFGMITRMIIYNV